MNAAREGRVIEALERAARLLDPPYPLDTDDGPEVVAYYADAAALRELADALREWHEGRGIIFEGPDHCAECRLVSMLEEPEPLARPLGE